MKKFHSLAKLKLHNDVADFIFATLGVTYSVSLSFIVIVYIIFWHGGSFVSFFA